MPGLSWTRRDPVWLLDYDVGGRVFRFATEPVSVTDAAGTTYRYEAGLDPLALGSTRMLGRHSVSVAISSDTDWAKIAARGIALDHRNAIVRLWFSGDDLELADTYIRGETEDVRHGDISEQLTLTVVEDPSKQALELPDAQAVATDETWPVRGSYTLTKGAEGKAYPIVIGYPGDHPKNGGIDLAEPAVPALWIERHAAGTDERWLVALGEIDAAQASLYNFESDTWQATDLSTAETTDSKGRTVTYVQTGALAPEDSEFWCGFRNASGWGGGVRSPYSHDGSSRTVLRGAGEVIRYFLDYFTDSRIDVARLSAGQDWLDRFKVDGAITSKQDVSEWLTKSVLDFLPVLGVDGSDGLYFAPLRWDATSQDAVANLDADKRQVYRDGPISQWKEPVYNVFTLDYRPLRGGQSWNSRRVLSALEGNIYDAMTAGANLPPFATSLPWMATTESDTRIYGSALCRESQARYGQREWKAEHPACWDDSTAGLILHYMAARYAWPKRQVRYRGGIELRSLVPGDIITLTDSDAHLSSVVCLVLERTTSISDVALDLVILDHPQRTSRKTS